MPRDTFAWISDGTSNTILIGEKHIHPENFQKWEGRSTALGGSGTSAENGYSQDVAYTHSSSYNFGDAWLARAFHKRDNTDVFGITRPFEKRAVEIDIAGFGSWHPGACNFLLGDGSVRALNVTTPPGSHASKGPLLALSCVNDGGTVNLD